MLSLHCSIDADVYQSDKAMDAFRRRVQQSEEVDSSLLALALALALASFLIIALLVGISQGEAHSEDFCIFYTVYVRRSGSRIQGTFSVYTAVALNKNFDRPTVHSRFLSPVFVAGAFYF